LPIAALDGGELRRLAASDLGDEALVAALARRSLRHPARLHPRSVTSREAKALANRTVH
jgi:hypothetical protein